MNQLLLACTPTGFSSTLDSLSPVRRFQDAANAVTAYATERGGDARRLVVAGARVRALAEKWGVGRLLEPAVIRALLDQRAADGGQRSAGAIQP